MCRVSKLHISIIVKEYLCVYKYRILNVQENSNVSRYFISDYGLLIRCLYKYLLIVRLFSFDSFIQVYEKNKFLALLLNETFLILIQLGPFLKGCSDQANCMCIDFFYTWD